MKERAYLLGPNESMLGIVSTPDMAPAPEKPTLVILNAGIVHRIGPHRNTVKLARSLCRAGYCVVRLDLSGIGDSAARRDALDIEAGALADISGLLDYLQHRRGSTKFVLMGLCSGADNSFYAAVSDDRIIGAVMLDGIAYQTPRYHVEHIKRRVLSTKSWQRLGKRIASSARKKLQRAMLCNDGATASTVRSDNRPDYIREFEPCAVVSKKFQQLIDRNVHTYWIYTAGMAEYYNYETQFRDMFSKVDFKGLVRHQYFESSNHTFTELSSQNALISAITHWVTSTF